MNQPSLIDNRANATIGDPRWPSIVNRDPATDGQFYYSVKTTGVYCRPSCAARPPKPENVQFYSSIEDAKKAGFRPCKRCKPDGPILAELNTQKVALACRLIERSEEIPSLKELALLAGMSVFIIFIGLSKP
jgi:AraC family transcriptional regulator of adaptative response/methylated-DNA-[protein]-cysteine methyltransferase